MRGRARRSCLKKQFAGSKSGTTDPHKRRQRGAILVLGHQQPICATIPATDELTRLVSSGATDYRNSPAPNKSHHNSFNPNLIWRDVVEVAVMTPAVGDGPPVADA